jgi:hypothetical protein
MSALHKYFRNNHFIFLLDGSGAVLSALLLVVAAYAVPFFGIPGNTIRLLLPAPVLFALYSFSCFLFRPANWRGWLTFIAVANLLYSCLTAAVVYLNFEILTTAGLVYLLTEIAVIVWLSITELRIANRQKERNAGNK